VSLRSRLLIAVGAVVILALGAANVATYSALRSFLFDRVDQTLQTTTLAVERDLQRRPLPESDTLSETQPAPPPALPNTLASVAPGTFVQVRDETGSPLQGETQPAFVPGGDRYTPRVPTDVEKGISFTVEARQSDGPQFRTRVLTLPSGEQLVVAVPLTETLATLNRLLALQLVVTAVALVAAGLLGWWLVRVGLRPLRDVERTAEAIADGNLQERVPVDSPRTEVGRLGHSFNVMLGRIEDAFAERDATEADVRASEDRLRRFVADASHELRTPLAAVSAYAELLQAGAVEQPEDLDRVMHGIQDETGRMKRLVDDLLLLARLDEGRSLESEPLELVGLTAQAVETARAVATDRTVRLDADRPLEVVGDRVRLRQVIDNLLGNVRAHTPPGTATTVSLHERDGTAVLDVADEGPGLTDEQLAHVFERFYRADGSRSRAHGGAGLGLAIVAGIVAAHGGSVTAANRPGGGAVFTVVLPLAESPAG